MEVAVRAGVPAELDGAAEASGVSVRAGRGREDVHLADGLLG